MLKTNCELEEEKAAELELRSRLFSFGEFNSDTQVHSWPVVTLSPGSMASLCAEHLAGAVKAIHKLLTGIIFANMKESIY